MQVSKVYQRGIISMRKPTNRYLTFSHIWIGIIKTRYPKKKTYAETSIKMLGEGGWSVLGVLIRTAVLSTVYQLSTFCLSRKFFDYAFFKCSGGKSTAL